MCGQFTHKSPLPYTKGQQQTCCIIISTQQSHFLISSLLGRRKKRKVIRQTLYFLWPQIPKILLRGHKIPWETVRGSFFSSLQYPQLHHLCLILVGSFAAGWPNERTSGHLQVLLSGYSCFIQTALGRNVNVTQKKGMLNLSPTLLTEM